ncbi:MAG: PDZ domain-containing protein [bacterium]
MGINTAISARGQGIGFAIPVNMIKTVLPQLADDGRVARSWLGVQIAPVTPELARSLGMKKAGGAAVVQVVPGGPAQAGGLREEDVILSFDGKPIERHDDLPWLASTAGIGRTVAVDLLRDGRRQQLEVKLGRMPGEDEQPARLDRQSSGGMAGKETVLGMRVVPVDRAVRTRLDVEGGAMVVGVDAGSPAERAGMERGDVIVRCNGQAVGNPEQLQAAIEKVPPGSTVRLLVQREGGRAFVAFTR